MRDWLSSRLLVWFKSHGRKDLPWQLPRSPYRVWLSEIMLQQTQVQTVIPYFNRFVQRFPDLTSLAEAPVDEVLHLWSGLGYYSRARNLHLAARKLVDNGKGDLPADPIELENLPGIGRSTAGAIAAMAYGIRAPILDGNVKRVLCRFHAIRGYPGAPDVTRQLWALADQHTPTDQVADYTQAIMDLGATLCIRRKPACPRCPLAEQCRSRQEDLTGEIPAPRPRRDLPLTASTFVLMLRHDGACLIERRPPTGIWGGLWSPPERPVTTTQSDLEAEFALELEETREIPIEPFVHTFTHFKLQVRPRVFRITGTSSIADYTDRMWYDSGINQPIGLSAVATRLLQSIKENRSK